MKQYQDLLKKIISEGCIKEPAREGMPSTKGIFGHQMRFNLSDGFPLLTTKKMPPKTIIHELIWFLKGNMNIKYLLDNNVHIWDKDAYRHFCKLFPEYAKNKTIEQFLEDVNQNVIMADSNGKLHSCGYLGELYGSQWRNWNGKRIDQIKKVIDAIKKNPDGRRHIVTAWNPEEIDNMALPPCHCLFQFNCRKMTNDQRIHYAIINDLHDGVKPKDETPKYYIDLVLTQRSADTFLGVPFNIASYSLLLEIIAKMCNMVSGEFIWNGNDVHIYSDHEQAVSTQLEREPLQLCEIKINDRVSYFEDISQIEISDITIKNYVSHPKIEANLSVGK